MTTLTERAAVAEDPTFQRRVRQAIVNAAIDIKAEDAGTTNHAARSVLAARVLAKPNSWASVFAVGVAQNPNVGTGVSDPSTDDASGDGALQFVANGLWNAFTE